MIRRKILRKYEMIQGALFMSIENIEAIATSVGLGGITGFLLGYFIRKIIKIILFAVGGLLALLMYLQYQGLITVNMAKIEMEL
jgi:uncharacterized membrane protein (Fun14 family)